MATITTREEQRSTAAAARKVGGYSELVRLSSERSRTVAGSVLPNRSSVAPADGAYQKK